MYTYQKTRYGLGEKLSSRAPGDRPPPRGFFAVNSIRMAMIANQLSQHGNYTPVEEELQARQERDMVHPCVRFGTMVNYNARATPSDLEEARRNQIRAAKALRDVSVYGEDSINSGICYTKFIWKIM